MTLRVLVMIAAPRDAAPFDANAAWRDLAEELKPLQDQGLLALERLTPATENALKKRLASGPCDVLHFIGHASWRPAARYGTLMLESSSGTARGVGTKYFGDLLQSLRLAVLQVDASGDAWDGRPALLMSAGPLTDSSQGVFARKFYASFATGSSLDEAAAHTRAALSAVGSSRTVVAKGSDTIVAPQVIAVAAAAPPPPPVVKPDEALANELRRKRAAAEFDVFLCHNASDKPRVRKLADLLESRGILPWLDERELPPGRPWQPLLEQQIGSIRAAAVCVGAAGVGPWQEQELYSFLREFVERDSPVIPVILEDAPAKPELPRFLKGMTWVDFRDREPEPLPRLIWAITGRRPD